VRYPGCRGARAARLVARPIRTKAVAGNVCDAREVSTPGPSLRQAKVRVIQAGKRINDLHALLDAADEFMLQHPVRITCPIEQLRSGRVSPTIDWSASREALALDDVAMLVSEAIQHLRIALEYVAYQVVWLDSGRTNASTEFPMVHKSAGWPQKVTTRLPGISAEHERIFKRLQPFRHCRWTVALQELSNVDKHRHVVHAIQTIEGSSFRADIGHVDPQDPTVWVIESGPGHCDVLLPNDQPALDVLSDLTMNVVGLIKQLEPDFDERDGFSMTATPRRSR
jgi:hypothetical protein